MGLLHRDRTDDRSTRDPDGSVDLRGGDHTHDGDDPVITTNRRESVEDSTLVHERVREPEDDHTRHDGPTREVERPTHLARSDRDTTVVERSRRDGASDAEVAEAEAVTPTLVRERSWVFAPGQLVSMVVGAAFVIVGTLALLRAGISEPLSSPVVGVLGFDHTAWLGLGEIALGLLLMLVGSGAWGRPLSVMVGAAMVVAGVLVLAEPGAMPDELALERAFGWPLILLGALTALAAMAMPVWRNTHTNVRTLDLHRHEQHHDDARRGGWRFWSR